MKTIRCKTLWDGGAIVAWSCDSISHGDLVNRNPCLGMEVWMTRQRTEKTLIREYSRG